uniref:Uncharacterized protein n=1 Tax=Anguilla anguilla TaxID=7936 RepID=A0A0E9UX05_ANGAN
MPQSGDNRTDSLGEPDNTAENPNYQARRHHHRCCPLS